MTTESSAIVQKVWNYCNVLRDDGVSYGDYVEQLTYLIFLKMTDEWVKYLKQKSKIPKGLDWQSFEGKDGAELEQHYRRLLDTLSPRIKFRTPPNFAV
jgi:type I restriction enzyme M protein